MIQLIRGFKDILPGEVELWQKIEETARDLFEDFGFNEIRLPIVEKSELFARSIGENTDIVEKEMYTFPDGKRGLVTLRPEATACAVRSYIQHKMYGEQPIQKLYTIGPMFRRERPQKGRYRQFYQINAEVFGIDAPYIDVQIIAMLTGLFNRLGVTDTKVHLNSLGCPECRPKFQQALLDLLADKKDTLCSDCVRRSDKNPLRVLDCKVEACREAVADAPSIIDYLCEGCQGHFKTVKTSLNNQGIEYHIDKRLVRGLDYYTRTIFEIQTSALGAQSAVAGGGRYDGLIKSLGGPATPAIGFAIGFDRLVEIIAQSGGNLTKKPDLYICAMGDEALTRSTEWFCGLGLAGIRCDMDYTSRNLKKQMKAADKTGASHVLIVGEAELADGAAILRNMETKEQHSIPVDDLIGRVKEILSK